MYANSDVSPHYYSPSSIRTDSSAPGSPATAFSVFYPSTIRVKADFDEKASKQGKK